MQLTIPMSTSSGGGSGTAPSSYSSYIDLNYTIYNARLLQFNIANAFTDGSDVSQAEWGLANLGARHVQNNAWNSQFALSTVSGNGALSLNSITRSFVNDIKDIKSGKILFGLFSETVAEKCVTLDFSTGKISNITSSLNSTAVLGGYKHPKGYIASSGGNYFIITEVANNTIKSIPCDVNGNIIAGTINTTTFKNFAGVVAAKGAYIWVLGLGSSSSTRDFWGEILTINSSGVFSVVNAPAAAIISGGTANYAPNNWGFDSWVSGNTCYIYAYGVDTTHASDFGDVALSFDLSNTSTLTYTAIKATVGLKDVLGVQYALGVEVGYDGSNVLVHGGTGLYSVNGSGYTTVAGLGRVAGVTRYRGSIDKFTLAVNNFSNNSDGYGLILNGLPMLTNSASIANNIMMIYSIDGTINEDNDAALKKVICKDAFSNIVDGLSFQVNGIVKSYDLIGNIGAFFIDRTISFSAGTKKLIFKLALTNTNSRQVKMGFGITGGTYLAPSGANNLSGDATNGWTYSTGGSYFDLTLS